MLSMPRIVRPDLFRFCRIEIGSPAGPDTRRSIKRNEELSEISRWELAASSGCWAADKKLAGGFEIFLISKKQHLIAGP
jgi:hypothetical protein